MDPGFCRGDTRVGTGLLKLLSSPRAVAGNPMIERLPEVTETPRRAALAFILITVTLDMLALGVIVPVLPRLVVDFVGGDTARGAEIYGLFGTVWALMQFLFS